MTNATPFSQDLHRASFFVGIDSDGCVFDTMEAKHRKAFVPALCEVYQLEHLAPLVEEVWTGINLYSRKRGLNRFAGLVQTLEEIKTHPVLKRFPGVLAAILPDMGPVREWMDTTQVLSNDSLAREVHRRRQLMSLLGHGRQDVAEGVMELERCLAWSERVNELAGPALEGVASFKGSLNFLRMLRPQGSQFHDPSTFISVVSQSAKSLLDQQWTQSGFADYVDTIHGQEDGNKSTVLRRYVRDCGFSGAMLMIGDAPGDLEAAQNLGAAFFPILPLHEAESWERLAYEAWPIFVAGGYRMEYQSRLIHEFAQCLQDARKEEQVLKRAQ